MAATDSPTSNLPTTARGKAFVHLKSRLVKFLRRTHHFFKTQTLSRIADKTCKIYLGNARPIYQDRCRRLLRSRITLDPLQLRRFFQTSVGHTLLRWIENFLHLPDHHEDPRSALQELLVQMAGDPEGLSLLSIMQQFPEAVKINLDQFLFTAKRVELLLKETDAILAVIKTLATAEVTAEPAVDYATLPDLRVPGPFSVVTRTLRLAGNPTVTTESSNQPPHRDLQVQCFFPNPWPSAPVAVIVQSHGLASSPEDLESYSRHLASHGFFVAAPWHSGSDVRQVRRMLAGEASEMFALLEFINRPLDISYLLDTLEQLNQPEFGGHLATDAVGVMGYSFGAYTGFALAGADIHFDTLETACALSEPNPSLLLQCQALDLPRQPYPLRDQRVKALLTLDSVGSEMFGPQGIGQIAVPTLLVAGSHDTAAPLVFEQIRIFQWLRTPEHYLAVIHGKSHIRDWQRLVRSLDLQIQVAPPPADKTTPPPFELYTNALSVAFFSRHLQPADAAHRQLSAGYGHYLSQAPYDLWLLSATSSAALKQQLAALDLSLMTELMELSS